MFACLIRRRPRGARHRIVGYLDESGTHAQARAVAVAGYLARWEDWQKFRKGWRRLLRRYEVSDFHMKDAAHFRNDFENWEPSRRDKFLSDAAQMIKRHTLVAFGCGFVAADYDANDEVDKYFLCLHGAIHFLLANMNRERPPIKLRFGENISFVFDQKPGFEGAAEKVFAHLRARHVLGERLLGRYGFLHVRFVRHFKRQIFSHTKPPSRWETGGTIPRALRDVRCWHSYKIIVYCFSTRAPLSCGQFLRTSSVRRKNAIQQPEAPSIVEWEVRTTEPVARKNHCGAWYPSLRSPQARQVPRTVHLHRTRRSKRECMVGRA